MNNTISLLRIAAMMFIVLYHCVCFYGIWDEIFPNAYHLSCIETWRSLANMALNVFVFISGFLFFYLYQNLGKYRNFKSFIVEKTARLIVPYLIWGVICCVGFSLPIFSLLEGVHHLWFVLMLFGVFFIALLVAEAFIKSSAFFQLSLIIFLFFVNALISKYGEALPNVLAWKRVAQYLPIFLWGGVKIRPFFQNNPKNRQFLMISIFSVISIVILFAESLPLGLLYRNLPMLFTISLLLSVTENFQYLPRIVKKLDRDSMGIYIIHHMLIMGVLFYIPDLQMFMNGQHVLAPLLLFVLVFLLSWGGAHCLNMSYFGRFIIGTKNK